MSSRWTSGCTVVAFAATMALGVFATPAVAATSDPCKVLKKSEIFHELDGVVGNPTKGLTTPVSKTCNWDVATSATRPSGTVSVHVMTIGGQAAYDGLKKITSQYVAVPELGKALYQQSTGALGVLQGGKYLTVQGVFIDTTTGHADVEPQLIALMKIARKRV